ncbi:MAG: hypothetical protein Q7P63_08900 [Verrucomicrobiota bacterium JB022]|nr:hypothetical protein [Verrucomicrobiota bacterium JB022]
MLFWIVSGIILFLALLAWLVGLRFAATFKRERAKALESLAELPDEALGRMLLEEPMKGRLGAIRVDAACAEVARRAPNNRKMWQVLEQVAQDRRSLKGRLAQAYMNSLRRQGL